MFGFLDISLINFHELLVSPLDVILHINGNFGVFDLFHTNK